jgi:dipeptidyl aminopeptidase/acylaminoacyl peptidase
MTLAPMTPEDIQLLRQVEDPRISPDGSTVAFTVSDPDLASNRYRRRIWMASARSELDEARPFTGEGVELLPRWSPDGRRLAFIAEREDGTSDICTLPAGTGGERLVVSQCQGRPSALAWSPDGGRLAFAVREPDAGQYGPAGEVRADQDMPPRRITRLLYRHNGVGWTIDRPHRIFVVAADGSGPARAVTAGPFQLDGLTWSPDGTRIAFASGRHHTWDLDLAVALWAVSSEGGGQAERLTADDGAGYSRPSWSPDGRRVAFLRNATPLESPRHGQVGVVDLASRSQWLLTERLDRNCAVLGAACTPVWAGDHLLFGAEDHGNVHLYAAAADGTAPPEVVIGGDRWVSEWDWAGGTLAAVVASATTLPELTVLATPGRPPTWPPDAPDPARQLTDLTGPLARRCDLVAPEPFVARSRDGSEVQCWAMRPRGAADGGRFPTLLNVHGGPFTQYGNHLFDEFQLQVAAGFAVLYCNPRGSSGYSEQWGRAVRWPECAHDPGSGWGGVDFEDVMACVDEAGRRFDWIDGQRVGILGGSYGGFMTSWVVGHTDRFKAACSERACNNLLSMEHSADIAGFLQSYVGVSYLEDPGAFLRHSPVSYVKAMTTPLLIVHSEDDLRCPINQAEELFVGLRRLGREPELVRFPGENHELSRAGSPRHRVMRAQLLLEWFADHLGIASALPTGTAEHETVDA